MTAATATKTTAPEYAEIIVDAEAHEKVVIIGSTGAWQATFSTPTCILLLATDGKWIDVTAERLSGDQAEFTWTNRRSMVSATRATLR